MYCPCLEKLTELHVILLCSRAELLVINYYQCQCDSELSLLMSRTEPGSFGFTLVLCMLMFPSEPTMGAVSVSHSYSIIQGLFSSSGISVLMTYSNHSV